VLPTRQSGFAVIRRFSPTRSLRIEQSPPYQEQIRQRCGELQSMQVLLETSVTHLLKAEDPLNHPKHVLDLNAKLDLRRLVALTDSSMRLPHR
jgi:hypothetical protein